MHIFLTALTAACASITAACNAYATWIKWQQETEIDKIEDEIDKLANIGDAAAKLRIERLHVRKKRKHQQFSTL
jgi:hypothetical protein